MVCHSPIPNFTEIIILQGKNYHYGMFIFAANKTPVVYRLV
jgi:hypothetical protein